MATFRTSHCSDDSGIAKPMTLSGHVTETVRSSVCTGPLTVSEALKRAGFNLPFAALACGERRVAAAGIVVSFQAIGSEAVDLLVDKLRHGAVGQVSGRRIHLVAMPWRMAVHCRSMFSHR